MNSLGPKGLMWWTTSFQVWDIHPNHYGCIYPIGTSEGMNARLITSLAVHARMNTRGSLEIPFYKISEISREEVYSFICFSLLSKAMYSKDVVEKIKG